MHTNKKKIAALVIAATLSLPSAMMLPATAMADELLDDDSKPVIVSGLIDQSDLVGGVAVSEYVADVAARTPIIEAPRVCVMSLDGDVLFGRGLDEECKIASITKIMTAIVAADYDENLVLNVSSVSANTPGSTAELWTGMQLTVKEAIKGLMLPSGNDAAYAIAAGIGEKMWLEVNPVPAGEMEYVNLFIAKMNEKAKEIGMEHTLFLNPAGLDDEGYEGEHHSTARDVAIMTAYAQKIPAIAEVSKLRSCDMNVINPDGVPAIVKLENTNHLLDTRKDALGMKTGFTDLAGNCFAGVYRNHDDGKEYVTVVLGRLEQGGAFEDTETLWDWLNDSRCLYDMTASCSTDSKSGLRSIGRAGVPSWTNKRVGLVLSEFMFSDQWYWDDPPTYEVELNVPEGTVAEGDVVGTFHVLDATGKETGSCDILASETVEAPSFFESIGVFFERIANFFMGKGSCADDVLEDIVPAKVDYDSIVEEVNEMEATDRYMSTDKYGLSNEDKDEISKLLAENSNITETVDEDSYRQAQGVEVSPDPNASQTNLPSQLAQQ